MIQQGDSWTTIEAEIEKCRILCMSCHSMKTKCENQSGLTNIKKKINKVCKQIIYLNEILDSNKNGVLSPNNINYDSEQEDTDVDIESSQLSINAMKEASDVLGHVHVIMYEAMKNMFLAHRNGNTAGARDIEANMHDELDAQMQKLDSMMDVKQDWMSKLLQNKTEIRNKIKNGTVCEPGRTIEDDKAMNSAPMQHEFREYSRNLLNQKMNEKVKKVANNNQKDIDAIKAKELETVFVKTLKQIFLQAGALNCFGCGCSCPLRCMKILSLTTGGISDSEMNRIESMGIESVGICLMCAYVWQVQVIQYFGASIETRLQYALHPLGISTMSDFLQLVNRVRTRMGRPGEFEVNEFRKYFSKLYKKKYDDINKKEMLERVKREWDIIFDQSKPEVKSAVEELIQIRKSIPKVDPREKYDENTLLEKMLFSDAPIDAGTAYNQFLASGKLVEIPIDTPHCRYCFREEFKLKEIHANIPFEFNKYVQENEQDVEEKERENKQEGEKDKKGAMIPKEKKLEIINAALYIREVENVAETYCVCDMCEKWLKVNISYLGLDKIYKSLTETSREVIRNICGSLISSRIGKDTGRLVVKHMEKRCTSIYKEIMDKSTSVGQNKNKRKLTNCASMLPEQEECKEQGVKRMRTDDKGLENKQVENKECENAALKPPEQQAIQASEIQIEEMHAQLIESQQSTNQQNMDQKTDKITVDTENKAKLKAFYSRVTAINHYKRKFKK